MRDVADLLMGDGWRPGLADALPAYPANNAPVPGTQASAAAAGMTAPGAQPVWPPLMSPAALQQQQRRQLQEDADAEDAAGTSGPPQQQQQQQLLDTSHALPRPPIRPMRLPVPPSSIAPSAPSPAARIFSKLGNPK
jgi:hypothetical protein